MQQQQLLLQHSPTLLIVEQPREESRFRYESESKNDRLGGILHGRSGKNSSVRIRIGNLNSQFVAQIRILACTVNEDYGPHPYFLRGDNCIDGCWRWQSDTGGIRVNGEDSGVDVSLSHLIVIACKKNQKDLQAAIRQRQAKVPELPNPSGRELQMCPKNKLDRVRLAFSLTFKAVTSEGQQQEEEFVLDTVYSDVITDSRKTAKLDVENVIPTEFQIGHDCTSHDVIGFYIKTATTSQLAKHQADVKAVFTIQNGGDEDLEFVQDVIEIKKHLIKAAVPAIEGAKIDNDRIKGFVTLRYNDKFSGKFSVVFTKHSAFSADDESFPSVTDRKRKLTTAATYNGDNVNYYC